MDKDAAMAEAFTLLTHARLDLESLLDDAIPGTAHRVTLARKRILEAQVWLMRGESTEPESATRYRSEFRPDD